MAVLQTVYIDSWNYLQLSAEETGTNVGSNTSSVHAWLDLYVTKNGHVASSGISVGVSGGSSSLGYQYYGSGWHRLCDGYYNAGHNSDGTGSTYVTGYFNSAIGNWSLGGTLGLSRIPRYFSSTPYISQASATTTSVTINWSTSENRDWSQYKIDGGNWTNCGDTGSRSGSFTISDLKANTTHSVQCQFRRSDSGLWSSSNTITIKTSDKTARVKANGEWKNATPYVKVGGAWKVAVAYVKNDTWKECK